MPFPDFDPVLIHIGPFPLRWYALAYVAGVLIGWRWCVHLVKKAGLWRGAAPTATPLISVTVSTATATPLLTVSIAPIITLPTPSPIIKLPLL